MKFNWGTGLMIGLGLFIIFILFFVIKISTDKKYDYDLVTEEYYAADMAYQTEIDAEKNSNTLSSAISGKKTAEGWEITFPENIDYSKVKGNVFLYRPSNKKLDFYFPLELTGSKITIPDDKLVGGRWNTIVQWSYNGKDYQYKEEIVY